MNPIIRRYLKEVVDVVPPTPVNLDTLTDKSYVFQDKFPTENARFINLKRRGTPAKELEKVINSTYPLVHQDVISLMIDFIEYKKCNGTEKEKEVYEHIGLIDFVNRIIKNRPATFYGTNDRYLLMDFRSGFGGFDEIGTREEKPPIILRKFMSYDEMKVAALLNISSESYFINNGARDNRGHLGKHGEYTPHGIIVAQIGARMKKPNCMEWQDCVISREQNTKENGYGRDGKRNSLPKVWEGLWKEDIPTWYEALEAQKSRNRSYRKLTIRSRSRERGGGYYQQQQQHHQQDEYLFNTSVYKKRMMLTAETFILDAKNRADEQGKKAYLHIVGLGLGVWKVAGYQESLYVDAWGEAMKKHDISHIAHVNFSWIDVDNCLGVKDGDYFHNSRTVIHFSKRNLHDRVPKDTFLMCNFAWDGNSLPGNEYWTNKTSSTGDSAAASSTCVAELHNHCINDMITGENLHVATPNGVFHIGVYAKSVLDGHLPELSLQKRDVFEYMQQTQPTYRSSKTNHQSKETWWNNSSSKGVGVIERDNSSSKDDDVVEWDNSSSKGAGVVEWDDKSTAEASVVEWTAEPEKEPEEQKTPKPRNKSIDEKHSIPHDSESISPDEKRKSKKKKNKKNKSKKSQPVEEEYGTIDFKSIGNDDFKTSSSEATASSLHCKNKKYKR